MTTKAERRLQAQLAVHTSWAGTSDPAQRTAPARRALLSRFELEVDPHGVLPEDERLRRADHAKRAHFLRLSLQAVKARREARRRNAFTTRTTAATVRAAS